MTNQTVSVVAPANLDAGYTFDATVDGRTFTVTVPEGGVSKGDSFQVPYPEDDAVEAVAIAEPANSGAVMVSNVNSGGGGPIKGNSGVTGRWRNGLCDCCETCCCPFWMGFCLNGILLGQVMQRFKLNPLAQPGDYSNTCLILTIITVIGSLLLIILGSAAPSSTVIYYAMVIYFVFITTITRMAYRKKYSIPASCCGESCMDDCCCAFWCGCCVVFQLHRHTHDEQEYPYNITSKTGLNDSAPEIV